MKNEEVTETIIGAAYAVHNVLGYGFLEKVYENSLVVELEKSGFVVEQQKKISVKYKDRVVGDYIADLIVNNSVIIEVKAVKDLDKIHEVQLTNYLKATGKEVGLLINFGSSVQVKRKVFTLAKKNPCHP